MTKKIDLTYLLISIIAFLLMSVSFLLMPVNKDSLEPNIFAGVLFWFSLIVGIAFQIMLSKRVKKNAKIDSHKWGLVLFFKNTYAVICDVMCIVSIIIFIIAMIKTSGIHYACYVFFALSVFFFSMHCILNGRNFYYIRQKNIPDDLNKEKIVGT